MEFLPNLQGLGKLLSSGGFGTVCALGNFDGVHLGHQKIISAVREKAAQLGVRSCAITFDPHPQKVLRNKTVHLLVPFEERLRLLEKTGIEITARLEFSKSLSLMPPERFIKEVMLEKAAMRAMVVGPRFGFGSKREGDANMLEELGRKFGFDTFVLEPVRVGGERVGSTRIRQLILSGRTVAASQLLGYRYYLKGTVYEGEKRGREIGFPTINIKTDWEIIPKPGVYATIAVIDGKRRASITNIGTRPTFGGGETVTETHLLDVDGNFYGKTAAVEFVKRVRDEKKFASARQLSERIKKDIEQVRAILKDEIQGEAK